MNAGRPQLLIALAFLAILALPVPCLALPTAYATWHMNEGSWNGTSGEVKDTAGSGFNGTAGIANGSTPTPTTDSGSPAYTSGGQNTCNYGLFGTTSGTRSYGYVGLPTTMAAFTSSFTITAWIRPTDNTIGGQRIFQRDENGNGWGLSLGDPGAGALRFYSRRIQSSGSVTGTGSNSVCNGGGVLCLDTAGSVIGNNTWYFVGAVVNTTAKTITMYVYNQAGTLLANPGTAYSGTWADGTGTPTIGGNTGASSEGVLSSYHFRGNLDEVQVFASALSQANVLAEQSLAQSGCAPDHYQLSLPTVSVNCLPTTVSLTACADSSSPCTNAYTGGAGATASLATSGGTLAAGSVTFNASGTASTTLSNSNAANGTAVNVTLSGESLGAANARQCCPNGSSCSVANSCSTTFNTTGFIISSSAGGASATIPTQTAGTTSSNYFLRAVQTNTSTGACTSLLTGAQSIQWTYLCTNPSTCSSGNLATINGNSSTAIPGSTTSASTSGPVPMTFDSNGNAPFSFVYNDVGQITLYSGLGVNGVVLLGISNAFVVTPAGFALSNIKQTASPNLANPGATGAGGSKFVKAGESFSATVTAKTSSGATAPNFGRETTPQGVLLTPNLVLPAGGVTGALSGATIAGGSFSNGVATVTNLNYGEVGIITLTPSISGGSYLGAGNVSGSTSGNIGRFVPAQFALSGGGVTHRSALSCSSSFTHLGENFRLGFTLTAQNLAGGTTANYTGSFAKLDPTIASGWNLAGISGSTAFSSASGRLALGSATGSWGSGVAGVTITANATRAAAPDGPFTAAAFGIAPVDSDGVAMASYDMAGTSGGSNDHSTIASVALRFGRLLVSSAMGAASRTLTLPVSSQYWTGSAFDTDTLDNCTAVPASAINFGNLRGSLTSADTGATGPITMASGVGTLVLAAPTSGHSGTFDLALSLGGSATDASCLQTWTPTTAAGAGANLSFLRGAWCGSSYGYDPTARASFGLQSTQGNLLYRRENY